MPERVVEIDPVDLRDGDAFSTRQLADEGYWMLAEGPTQLLPDRTMVVITNLFGEQGSNKVLLPTGTPVMLRMFTPDQTHTRT